MTVELSRKDLVHLVYGIHPPYDVFEHPLVKRSGTYIGGFVDKWQWNSGFDVNLSENDLWSLYLLCRDGDKPSNPPKRVFLTV